MNTTAHNNGLATRKAIIAASHAAKDAALTAKDMAVSTGGTLKTFFSALLKGEETAPKTPARVRRARK